MVDEERRPTKSKIIENPEDSKKYRNFNCPYYYNCLNDVVNKRWQSFSCRKCKNYYISFNNYKFINEYVSNSITGDYENEPHINHKRLRQIIRDLVFD